jgi:excisionase family DNA binding protein
LGLLAIPGLPRDREHRIECRWKWKARGHPKRSAMNAQVKIDDVSELAAEVRALREEIRRLRESTPQSLVDLKAAAAHLGVSTRTLRRWVDAGRVPFRRVGRTLRFPLAALNPR